MTTRDGDLLVLSTTNAPYRRRIDAQTLAESIRTGDAGSWTVQVATFFVDVHPELVVRFAERHEIDFETLARSYRSLRDETGERSIDLEAEFARFGLWSEAEVGAPLPRRHP